MAVLFSDNFNRANAATLGASYTVLAGGWNILSNEAQPNSTISFAYVNTVTTDDDCYIKGKAVTIGNSAGSIYTGLYVRLNTTTFNGYGFTWWQTTGRIFRLDGGTPTTLGATISPPTAGQTVELLAVGNQIAVYYDGVLQAARTDATYGSGARCGIEGAGISTKLDDLEIGNIESINARLIGQANSQTTSLTTTGGLTHAASSTFVAIVAGGYPGAGITPGDNKGNTYELALDIANDTGYLKVYVCEDGTGGAGHALDFDFTDGGSGLYNTGYLIELFANDSSPVLLAKTANALDAATPYTVSITPDTTDELILAAIAFAGFPTGAISSSNTTLLGSEPQGDFWWANAVSYALRTATTAFAPSFTNADNGDVVDAAVAALAFNRVGEAGTTVTAAGTAAGSSTASGASRATARAAGTAAGAASVSGAARATARATGVASSLASTFGGAIATARAAGSSAGTATAAGAVNVGTKVTATGTASGSSSAAGAARATARAAGSAAGVAEVNGAGIARVRVAGSAAGSATAQGASRAAARAAGTAAGAAAASGGITAVARAAGVSAGTSSAVGRVYVDPATIDAAAAAWWLKRRRELAR